MPRTFRIADANLIETTCMVEPLIGLSLTRLLVWANRWGSGENGWMRMLARAVEDCAMRLKYIV